MIQSNMSSAKKQNRQIFYDDNKFASEQVYPAYEENLDIGNHFNPLVNTNHEAYKSLVGVKTNQDNYSTIPKVESSPIKPLTSSGGRMQPKKANEAARQAVSDPDDIDDDVSDHGPESIEQQLKTLDGMNKYMQNIRVPTSKGSYFLILKYRICK